MPERRRHPRGGRSLEFCCYVEGVRFDSSSLNISEGGAFLATSDAIQMDAMVLVVPMSAKRPSASDGSAAAALGNRVLLVGRVVRHQAAPVKGVGIRWVKCVSRSGLDALLVFLGVILDIFPSSLPLPPIWAVQAKDLAWDFIKRCFQVVELEGARGRPPPRSVAAKARSSVAPLPASPATPMTRGRGDGAITTIVTKDESRVPVKVSVEVSLGGTICYGTVLALAASVLTLRLPEPQPSGVRSLVLAFPISYKQQTELIFLACRVEGVERGEGSEVFLDLSIHGVDGEPSPGIFLRYVKYLFFHRVVDDE